VFENRVVRKLFGPKREEVTGDWRKSYKDLCALSFVPRYHQSDHIKQHHIPDDSNPLHNDGVHVYLTRGRKLMIKRFTFANCIKFDCEVYNHISTVQWDVSNRD
jgi:hypothetical protein